MNKIIRNIIFLSGAIVLLIVGTIIVLNIDMSDEESSDNNEDYFTIYSENTSDIKEVEVTNAQETIRAVNLGDSTWTINDLSIDEIDTSKAFGLAGTVSTLTSKNKIEENPSDLTQYGLDSPSITVTITKNNGDVNNLYIGDKSPTLGEYFVMKDDENVVYTIYDFKVDTLMQPLNYYQEFNRFKVNINDISDIKIVRSDETIEIKLIDNIDKNTNNVWEMVSPYQSGANDDYIDNKILEPIEDITLSNPIENFENRFDNTSPVLIITVKPYNNATGKYEDVYTETLTVGETDGEKTFVKYKNKVFTTPTESISFVNDSSYNIVSKLQALVDVSLVKSVTLEYGGSKHTIDITHNDGDLLFKFNGENVESDITQSIYKNIVGLSVDGVYNGENLKDSILKITYKGIKDDNDTEVDLREINDLNCALVRNGKTEFTMKKSKINEFIELFDSYVKSYN